MCSGDAAARPQNQSQCRVVCAVHQPNFFPWLGYFDKIRRADTFVFLDAVSYPRSGSGMGSWANRVRIDIQGSPRWFGCPLRRWSGPLAIRDVRIDDGKPWRRNLLRTLEINYKRAPGFERTMTLLAPLLEYPTDHLAEFNEHAVRTISVALGLECRFVRQSDLAVEGRATELLVEIVKAVGADAYLAGGGAAGYQVDGMFAARGIELLHQDFEPARYGRQDRFLPALSVIDYLMWGWIG